jgi:hypothetical protein
MNALDEIKHLYFNATKATIQRDLTRAITLLKGMKTEAEREKAAVYMDGLSQMRSEWAMMGRGQKRRPGKRRF